MFLLNEDVPLATVSAVLGHRNQRTTERYYCSFIEKRKIAKDLAELQVRLAGRGADEVLPIPIPSPPRLPQPPRFRPAQSGQKGGAAL